MSGKLSCLKIICYMFLYVFTITSFAQINWIPSQLSPSLRWGDNHSFADMTLPHIYTAIKNQPHFAFAKLIENISPADTDAGVVVAAKSKNNPDYYYHWVRDA